MSAKWHRSQRWDREHLRGLVLAPVRWVLHAFSSIPLAVVLLAFVALYALLASVPLGLLAQVPTWLVIGLLALLMMGGASLLLGVGVRSLVPRSRRGVRFTATVAGGLLGFVAAVWLWRTLVWPALEYDPVTGGGLRLFADTIERYGSTTLRRVPGIELTELEFYSAWPLRVVLLLFVVNMFVATVRRIEFNLKNAGVLTVHAGILVIALASVYYQAFKQEGDTILLAGEAAPGELPGVGAAQPVFYDATRVAVWASQQRDVGASNTAVWEQRRIHGLPRYNAYGLRAGLSASEPALLSEAFAGDRKVPVGDGDAGRALAIDLPGAQRAGGLDADIALRVVGYAPYADLRSDVRLFDATAWRARDSAGEPSPVRELELLFDGEDQPEAEPAAFRLTVAPGDPVRGFRATPVLGVEMTRGMSAARWADLTTVSPAGASDVLIVEIPGDDVRVVIPARPGEAYTIGQTGWEVGVRQFSAEPPFPIISPGYEGASSSVAVLRMTSPDGQVYDRWVYSRFPEISQDVYAASTAGGRPMRQDADPAIRVAYLDHRREIDLHLDEVTPIDADEPRWRMAVRQRNGTVRVVEDIRPGQVIADVARGVGLVVRAGWAHGEPAEQPAVVPTPERDARMIGTHDMATVALEVSTLGGSGEPTWSRVVWLPFTRYMSVAAGTLREVRLPDGRVVTLGFGRLPREFPGFALRLMRFEMVSYDHRGSPRDYRSMIAVEPRESAGDARGQADGGASFRAYERVAKLNAPLRAPYVWDDDRPWILNALRCLSSGLNPSQYKISQAGWDREGWLETQRLADAGELAEPYARFTIMQVGNNPGIHLIAIGGVMMAVGIPWAFYVKPWMVRRERARVRAALAGEFDVLAYLASFDAGCP